MRIRNRIALRFFAVVLTVSFLHPFSGINSYAEEDAREAAGQKEDAQENTEAGDVQEEPENSAPTEKAEETKTAREDAPTEGAEETQTAREDAPTEEAEETEETKDAREDAPTEEAEEAEETQDAREDAPTEEAEEMQDAREDAPMEEAEETETVQEPVMARSTLMRAAPLAAIIDGENPEVGQSNTFGYTGGEVQWMVPVSGYYDVYCYGAEGGSGSAHESLGSGSKSYARASGGDNGKVRGSRAFLQQGMILTMHAGGMGGNGEHDTYRGNEKAGKGGYSDGERGSGKSTICDNEHNHNGSCASGGGGGSSYILYKGTKIISAAGGKGGEAEYKCVDGEGYADGGTGGGVNALNSADTIEWRTAELNVNQSGANSGNGSIQLTLVKMIPVVRLQSSCTDWTCDDIALTATVKSEGSGLPENYLSWEKAEDGSDLWTDSLTYIVKENGIYTCRIRDVDGNIGETEITVDNIDKLEPSAEITAPQEWTTDPIVMTVSAKDQTATDEYGCCGLAAEAYLWGKDGEDTGTQLWGADTTYTVTESGSYYCKVRDKAGNVKKVDYNVGCIDVSAPDAEMTADQTRPTWKDVTLTVTAVDDGIGLAELPYCWEQDENGEGIWTDENTFVTDKNGHFICKVRDALGNVTEVSCDVQNIDKSLKNRGEDDGGHSHDGGDSENTTPDKMLQEEMLSEEILLPEPEIQSDGQEGDDGHNTAGMIERSRKGKDMVQKLQEMLGMADQEPEIVEEEIITSMQPVLSPEPEHEAVQKGTVQKGKPGKRFFDDPDIQTLVLYSAWIAVVLCGLVWLLFSLLLEHVTVYRTDRRGKFHRVGQAPIIRKREYKQINLTPLQEKGDDRQYKLRFSIVFSCLHKKEKVLVRTYQGVELRNVGREIRV